MNKIYADVSEIEIGSQPDCQWVVLASEVEERESAILSRESLLKEKLTDCEGLLLEAESRLVLLSRLLSEALEYTRHPDYDWDIGFSTEVVAAL